MDAAEGACGGRVGRFLFAGVAAAAVVMARAARAVVFAAAATLVLASPLRAGGPPDLSTPSADQEQAVQGLIAADAPIYCGGPTGRMVALTFDDGPGPYSRALLDALARGGARGTFFDIGSNVTRFPGVTRREGREGVVADHSWSHPDLTTLTPSAVSVELGRTQAAISSRTGGSVTLFRPPYERHDATVDSVARSLGLLTVLWSVGAGDTTSTDPALIASLVDAGVRPGSIVLMHENNNNGGTVAALGTVLAELASEGLEAVTVPELLAADPPTARQLRTGPYGCGPAVTGLSTTAGPSRGGTAVIVAGQQLDPVNQVLFGNQPARSVTALSADAIEVVSPPGHGTVDVTVTTHFSSSPPSSLDTFTYH